MSSKKSSVPQFAQYPLPTAPAAAPAYTPPPNYQAEVPQVASAGQLMSQANQLENPNNTSSSWMPSLSLDPNVNPIASQADQQAYANAAYDTQLAPQLASEQTALQQQGRDNSSFGGAELGQMLAQANTQKTLYGQQYYTNALNNLMNARQSFTQGSYNPAETQSNANVQRGLGVAQIEQNANQNQNQYNLGATQAANQVYGTQASLYGTANQLPLQSYKLGLQQQEDTTKMWGGIGNSAINTLASPTWWGGWGKLGSTP